MTFEIRFRSSQHGLTLVPYNAQYVTHQSLCKHIPDSLLTLSRMEGEYGPRPAGFLGTAILSPYCTQGSKDTQP